MNFVKKYKLLIDKQKLINIAETILLFFCLFMPAIYIMPGKTDTEASSLSVNMLQYIISSLPQLLLLLYIIWLRKDVGLKNFGITKPRLKDLLWGAGLAITLFFFIALLSLLLQLLPGSVRDFVMPENPLVIKDKANFLLVVVFSLVTGYKEELFFRSYLLTRFRQWGVPLKAALVFSALLFALLHLYEGLLGFVFAGIVAVFFSLVYIKTKSLHLIAISHGIFNAAMIILSQIQQFAI